jgi:cytidine deaminase
MKTFEIKTTVVVVDDKELSAADRALVAEAREATRRSYAPYSRFSVGAAIALDNGETVVGCNQENAAYPSGLCAERTAAFYAHARYPEARFQTLAIAARDTTGEFLKSPISPCGACRQVLLEYEKLAGSPVRVILVGATECYIFPSVVSLMPFAFQDFE